MTLFRQSIKGQVADLVILHRSHSMPRPACSMSGVKIRKERGISCVCNPDIRSGQLCLIRNVLHEKKLRRAKIGRSTGKQPATTKCCCPLDKPLTCRFQGPDIPQACRVRAHGGAAERGRAGQFAQEKRVENKSLQNHKRAKFYVNRKKEHNELLTTCLSVVFRC